MRGKLYWIAAVAVLAAIVVLTLESLDIQWPEWLKQAGLAE